MIETCNFILCDLLLLYSLVQRLLLGINFYPIPIDESILKRNVLPFWEKACKALVLYVMKSLFLILLIPNWKWHNGNREISCMYRTQVRVVSSRSPYLILKKQFAPFPCDIIVIPLTLPPLRPWSPLFPVRPEEPWNIDIVENVQEIINICLLITHYFFNLS